MNQWFPQLVVEDVDLVDLVNQENHVDIARHVEIIVLADIVVVKKKLK
jgi:hypothetical protein